MWRRNWSLALVMTATSGLYQVLLAQAKCQSNTAFQSSCPNNYRRFGSPHGIAVFAAAGFGSSSSSSTQTMNKKATGSKKRKRLLEEKDVIEAANSYQAMNTPSTTTTAAPQLDKWGLPIAKDDDIFPPMPPGTELIAADKDRSYSLSEIQQAVQPHLELPGLNRFFDERGDERRDHNHHQTSRPAMKLCLLHQSPPILAIENFLTQEECEQVQSVALSPTSNHDNNQADANGAYQVNSATFALAQSRRTSTSWFCHYAQVPTLLAKMHHVLGIPLEHMEEPQVVRYQAGQEFSWHYDEVPPPQLDNGGQRLGTFLVYLQDVAPGGGGGTVFRDLRDDYSSTNGRDDDQQPLTVQPKQGMACLFFPAFSDGQADDRTLHKGQVLAPNSEKWISQIWIHERSYQPVLPPGNSHQAAWSAMEQVSRQLGLSE